MDADANELAQNPIEYGVMPRPLVRERQKQIIDRPCSEAPSRVK
jgi:hypothetical protein